MIHQVYITDTPSEILLRKAEAIKKEYEHKLWLNDDVITLLKDEFEPDVLWAYDELIPYSFKADLAKYAIMYIHGGWYIDVSFVIISNLYDYNNESGVYFKDFLPETMASGMFYSPPKNEMFKDAINIIVNNCKSIYYGNHPTACTGPGVFTKAYITSDNHSIGELQFINNTVCFVLGDTLLARGKQIRQEGGLEFSGDVSGGNYFALWRDGKIYKSQLKINL
jgi:mannosyltransferase OCH1-like enzyme